ncbi:unnamed protein product [Trifolium pratense]|uniref:Uncharacterized protein n=1 Tax=Trifolium pratense TaxID=57577 RepID=A0ACB0LMQ6_TRIPR|nr:unnamed protein product [Trifolium pratense]
MNDKNPLHTNHLAATAGSVSIFVDAGCSVNAPTGWGLVFKDHNSVTTFSACKRGDISVDPIMAEALGIIRAIQLARDLGLNYVSIFSDAATVVDYINKKAKIAAIDMVVQDCRALISSLLNVSVMFVRRDQIGDAHNLASLAKVVGNRTWIGVTPIVFGISNYAGDPVSICIPNGCVPAFI